VSIVDRDGQHRGKDEKLLANVVPAPPIRARVWLRAAICSTFWSSVMTSTMFGRTFVPA